MRLFKDITFNQINLDLPTEFRWLIEYLMNEDRKISKGTHKRGQRRC